MDLNDIQTFVIVSETGTFSAAAKELRIPTSTVSRSITRLEDGIGAVLYQRSPRGLTLTNAGQSYLRTCKEALRSLRTGQEVLEKHRANPGGLIRIGCPITLARDLLAPILHQFIERYPALRVQIEPYCSGWEQEPREGVDIFFRVRAPKDSGRRIKVFPATVRALYASTAYVEVHGTPTAPGDLTKHRCIGEGEWTLHRNGSAETPEINFHFITSDPGVHLELACAACGIVLLPVWMARQPRAREVLIPVLPEWQATPLFVCALFSGAARLTPKIGAFLDFMSEYFGTASDPRLHGEIASSLFLSPKHTSEP